MKRCPECRRDYHDDSLLYCLDDGSALLDGPATAILKTDRNDSLGRANEETTRVFSTSGPRTVGNLPAERTSFIGRQKELNECVKLAEATRLLTLTGFGGCGKTRLAIKTARDFAQRFPDGAWFADLSQIIDPAAVALVVGRLFGIRDEAGKQPTASLAGEIGSKELILVLDNCEHLLEACARLADALLEQCPNIQLIATSRQALNIRGERVLPLRPLNLEPDDSAGMRSDAMRLFVERAQAAAAGFSLTTENSPAVAEIVRRLDGIPLAIELAAARVKLLSVEQIRTMLSERFRLLSTAADKIIDPRHKTLQATIQWSYDPLSEDEKHMLGALSAFPGGCNLESVTKGAGTGDDFASLEILSQLVDKSLIVVEEDHGEQRRYGLLETVKEFVLESLQTQDKLNDVRDAQFRVMLGIAERAYAGRVASEEEWGGVLETERANMLFALEFARGRDSETYLTLAGALGWFWIARSHIFEGREHLTAALAATSPEPARPARARALWGAAHMLAWQGDNAGAQVWMDEALDAWRRLDDDAEVALALEGTGWTQFYSSDDEAARVSFEECLRIQREAGDPPLINRAMVGLAQVLIALDRTEEARRMADEIIEFSINHKDRRSEHFGWHYLADCALIERRYEESLELYKKSLEIVNALGDKIEIGFEIQGVAMSLSGLSRSREAIVLAAAVDAEMDRIGADVHVRFWDALTEHHFSASKLDLGDEAYRSARDEGAGIPFQRAVEMAGSSAPQTSAASGIDQIFV
jgi:predicted ATPase